MPKANQKNNPSKGPGQWGRVGLSHIELLQLFPDNKSAMEWFEDRRWGRSGRVCPNCNSESTIEVKHPSMPYHCSDCRKRFSVKMGTVMEASKISYQKWAIAVYLMTTGIKGVSSMKMHRDLGISQKTAWFLTHRIRQGFIEAVKLQGEVEADETYLGGKETNRPKSKRRFGMHGGSGKVAVFGAKERGGKVYAKPVPNTTGAVLGAEIEKVIAKGSTVYTDEARAYGRLEHLNYNHHTIRHSAGEYVNGMIHTNGIESFWASVKRGLVGVYHHWSEQHTTRYMHEFACRQNDRQLDTIKQMGYIAGRMVGRRLTWNALTTHKFS